MKTQPMTLRYPREIILVRDPVNLLTIDFTASVMRFPSDDDSKLGSSYHKSFLPFVKKA
jgi:hypothetical protein